METLEFKTQLDARLNDVNSVDETPVQVQVQSPTTVVIVDEQSDIDKKPRIRKQPPSKDPDELEIGQELLSEFDNLLYVIVLNKKGNKFWKKKDNVWYTIQKDKKNII